ncbi:hypothetical protein GUJ93_ZPchr0006g42876 [Zizania palustris]|uniref:Uncharacterized protein n=1 Tax=Zizania palustris TaxID=103762 RepID=A0A8J5TCI1_ZIZPA|nr:hypothetical protein GUJ93_ZPchr0006g42876 [Zizania palustris]
MQRSPAPPSKEARPPSSPLLEGDPLYLLARKLDRAAPIGPYWFIQSGKIDRTVHDRPGLDRYTAEFIATLLFVFAGVGSAIAYGQLSNGGALDPAGLVAIAIAHALALFVGVSIAANVSGGHLNPAVTFGLAVGGHITILTGLFYWVAQLLGASVACLLLKFVTHGKAIPTHGVTGISALEGVVLEIVITFALVYTVYATAVDPKKGSLGTIAPIAIGFIVGANILAAGPFSGGSMNPARSFGPAVAAGNFAGNWVYWVGPLIGGGLAGLVYGDVFASASYQPVADQEYA